MQLTLELEIWGWSETNLRPWEEEFGDIKQGSKRSSWDNKQPRAYWKCNPDVVTPIRMELMKCNHSRLYGARLCARTGKKRQKVDLNSLSSLTNAITGTRYMQRLRVVSFSEVYTVMWFNDTHNLT